MADGQGEGQHSLVYAISRLTRRSRCSFGGCYFSEAWNVSRSAQIDLSVCVLTPQGMHLLPAPQIGIFLFCTCKCRDLTDRNARASGQSAQVVYDTRRNASTLRQPRCRSTKRSRRRYVRVISAWSVIAKLTLAELSDYVRQAVPPSELNHPPQPFNPNGTFDPSGPSAYYYGPPGQTDPVQPMDPYPTDWNPDGFLSFPNEFPDSTPATTHAGPNTAFTMTLAEQFQPFSNPDGYDYLQGYDSTGQVLVSDLELVHGTPPPPALGSSGPTTNGAPPPHHQPNGVGASGPERAAMPPPSVTGPFTTPAQVHAQSTFPSGPTVPLPNKNAPYVYTPLLHSTPTPASAPVAQDQTNAQQKANAAKYFRASRQTSIARSTPSVSSPPSTPDSHVGPPLSSTVDPKSPNPYGRPLPNPGMWYGAQNAGAVQNKTMFTTSHIDPIDGITESLGEFLFNPIGEGSSGAGSSACGTPGGPDEGVKKKRKGTTTNVLEGGGSAKTKSKGLIRIESDGLTDSARELL